MCRGEVKLKPDEARERRISTSSNQGKQRQLNEKS
jgi:hypothetical protein